MHKYEEVSITGVIIWLGITIALLLRLNCNISLDNSYKGGIVEVGNTQNSLIGSINRDNIQIKNTKNKSNNHLGYIYIGDSRFVGMEYTCKMSNNKKTFVIAKVGEGYKWFSSKALKDVENIKRENKSITKWEIIIGLGVNDLYNIDKYMDTYKEMLKKDKLVLVAINPIQYHKTITNKDIEKFNSEIKQIKGVRYIDTYNYLIKNGYNTTDGLHYDSRTYEKIYNKIKNSI